MKRHQMVRWEAPSPAASSSAGRISALEASGGVWREVADALRAKPGEWAVVRERGTRDSMASLSSGIRFGVFHDFRPPLSFDAVVRHKDGTSTLYARYAPGDAE